MVTSIKVDGDLWKRAKKKAIDEEITLQELLDMAITDWLKKSRVSGLRHSTKEN